MAKRTDRKLTYDENASSLFWGKVVRGKLTLFVDEEEKVKMSRHETSELLSLLYDNRDEILSHEPEEIGDDPVIVECPYCGNSHYENQIQQCPLNPHKGQ